MEQFEADATAQNISSQKRWSGFGPVDTGENRENKGPAGNLREGLNTRKIN
jgi:hypothetical protein